MTWFPLFIVPAIIAFATGPIWAPGVWRFVSSFITAEGRLRREVEQLMDIKIAMVAALLRDGRGWNFGHYCASHRKLGISIWIANSQTSLGIRFDGQDASPRDGKLTERQKRKIWTAYLGRGEDAKQAATQLEEFFGRVRDYQDTLA